MKTMKQKEIKNLVKIGAAVDITNKETKAEAAREWIIQNDTYYKSNPDELDIDVFEMNGERID